MQQASVHISEQSLLWSIKITLRIKLAEADVSVSDQPRVLYLQVPRQTYLNTLIPQIKPFWAHVLGPGEDTPWFEHQQLPLKWNVPVGVMYDLLVPEHEEPWSLTLHFRDFPTDTLPLFSGESDLRLAYFNSLKEAGHICNGTAQSVMEMVVGARDDLWRAVVQSDVEKAKARLRSIRLHGSSTAYTKVPVRLFIREVTGQHGYLSSYENVLRTSRPVAILAPESGTRTTLRDALLPLLMPSCSSEHNALDDNVWGSKVRRLWVGGIEPSPDIALVDLHKELHCPDFFLYIVAHVNTPL